MDIIMVSSWVHAMLLCSNHPIPYVRCLWTVPPHMQVPIYSAWSSFMKSHIQLACHCCSKYSKHYIIICGHLGPTEERREL